MKLIHNFKSPNFNKRQSNNIKYIIIHYTALGSISESLEYLCKKKNKVSSHYLISKEGTIYNLVSDKKRAWHAGISYWNEDEDINSHSIGIELDYSPYENKKFTKELLESLIKLLKKLISKYNIPITNVLGHSDVSPYRKIDPGVNFPWVLLEKKNIAFKLKKIKKTDRYNETIKKWFKKNKLYSNKKKILLILSLIGYDIRLAKKNHYNYKKIISAYTTRFSHNNLKRGNLIDIVILHFLNILLTK